MNPLLLTTCGLLLATAMALGTDRARTIAADSSFETFHDLGCKPSAPVRLTVTNRSVNGARATLRYVVETEMDVQSVWVEALGDANAQVTSHLAANAAQLARGAQRSGEVKFDLSQADARALLRVHYTFMGADNQGNQALESLQLEHFESFGTNLQANEVVPVETDGELSLSMPALQL
jgi:hypothetical protein